MNSHRNDLFVQRESIDRGEYIFAKYLIKQETDDYLRLAGDIAIEQSTGSWTEMPLETSEMIARHGGKVTNIFEVPDYEYEVKDGKRTFLLEVAFPSVNFGNQVPMLLTSVIGVISMLGGIKLIDLTFPDEYTSKFPGPQYGINGLREMLGVQQRPLLACVIKPPAGLTPKQAGEYFYKAASGGADIIKDDEKIANASYSSVSDRVHACMKAEKRAYEETGKHTLYAVNITDTPLNMKDNLHAAIDAGANMIMLCHLTAGIGIIQDIAESDEINLPILAHPDFVGGVSWSANTGMSSHLSIGKLPRLCGVDISAYPMCYGRMPILKEKYLRIAIALRSPFYNILPSWPQVGGALHPGMVKLVIEDLGADFVMGAGGSVSGHPLGPKGGAQALLQAAEAVLDGRDLRDAAKEHEALRKAIEKWGVVDKKARTAYGLK